MNSRTRALASVALAASVVGALASLPRSAAAQYFGRNKVQYQSFKFRTMHTEHFDLYFYPPESLAVADAARMAERWYARHEATLHDRFDKRSIVIYADAPDFEQTNVIGGFISQGTGGVTEGAHSRVVLPLTGVYADDDHVLGHELVHVFQYDIAASTKTGMAALDRLPLWLIEGMAEYLSLGRDDPNTAMWLRDAALRNDLPSIKQLSTDPRFFPYRYGEALWAYIGGRWGDEAVNALYRTSLEDGWEPAVRRVLGVSSDSLSAQWLAAIRATYDPVMAQRTRSDSVGVRLLRPSSRKYGDMDVSPALSPDGKYVAFLTSRGLFDMELYVADAETGRIVKKLTGPNTDQHFDALSFINASGSWSPDGKQFAFIVYADGDNEIDIFDVASRDIVKKIHPKGVTAINDVSWSPDGRHLALSGMAGGISDLYVYDLSNGSIDQLTNDRYADLQPAWSPDGKQIAWATDRGPRTNFTTLQYGPVQLAVMDVATRQIRLLPTLDNAKAINPQFSPDGRTIFFVSDRGGFDDVYRVDLATGAMAAVTHVATGVSGITALSPTLTVASHSGRMMFSLFERGGYSLHRLDANETAGTPITGPADTTSIAGVLPPADIPGGGAVTQRVADATTGLPPQQPLSTSGYRSGLTLDYVGSPGVGVSFGGPFGTQAGGGVAAYWSDLLGNHVVGAQIAGGGDIRDFGGGVIYQDLAKRLNWGVSLSHTPYLTGFVSVADTAIDVGGQTYGGQVIEQSLQRTYYDQLTGIAQYPLSSTRRFEVSAGYTRVSYGIQVFRWTTVGNVLVSQDQFGVPGPPSLNLGQASAAFVGDYSYFGFTSPVAGGRYRFEVDPTFGDLNFQSVLADYRRYFLASPVTFAFRFMHYGRYGRDAEDPRLFPLYVGDPYFIRGYDVNSFTTNDCVGAPAGSGACPAFDRLIGSRIGVANFELRIPLLGTEQFGLINFPYLATEIAPFFDAGVAWTAESQPVWQFSSSSLQRVPVFSAGLSARFNVLGYLVAEVYYAKAFQRPGSPWRWGFQLMPGW